MINQPLQIQNGFNSTQNSTPGLQIHQNTFNDDTIMATTLINNVTSGNISTTEANGRKRLTSTEYYMIGVTLSICGNIIIAIALNCQKLAHRKRSAAQMDSDQNKSDEVSASPAPNESNPLISRTSYLRYSVWWAGIVLMAIGEIGNFVAYGFAPASVVAPLGSFAVIANGFVAMIMNNESLRMRDLVGTAFTLVGCFFIVQFSNQEEEILDSLQIIAHLGNWQFIVYMCVQVIGFAVLTFIRSQSKNETRSSVLLHLALVSIAGSFTVISAKAVSGMLTLTAAGDIQVVFPVFYIMLAILIITIVYQVKYLNEAMAIFDIAVVVPVNFVMFTVSAILAGALFYDEFFSQSGITILLFFFGCSLSIIGVIFITGDKPDPEDLEGVEAGALHLDMMPNFIRSLAPSFKVTGVQPKPNETQAVSADQDKQHNSGEATSLQ